MNFGPHTSEADSLTIMDAAIANGINFFDTANVYGRHLGVGATEEIIGRWIAKGGGRRDKVVLATKVYGTMGDWPNESRLSKLRSCVNASSRCDVSAPTASISTRCTTSTGTRGGTRSGRPWNSSSARGRSSTSAPRTSRVAYRAANEIAGYRIAGPRDRAVPLQPHRPHDRARGDSGGAEYGMGLIPWSPLAGGRLAGALSEGRRGPAGRGVHARGNGDEPRQARAVGGVVRRARRASRRRRDRLAAAPTGRHGADHRTAHRGAAPGIDARARHRPSHPRCSAKLDEIFPGPGGPAPEAYAW